MGNHKAYDFIYILVLLKLPKELSLLTEPLLHLCQVNVK